MSLALRLAKIIFAVVGGGGKFIQGTAMSEVDAGRDRSTPAAAVAL